jgi:hypothetical protein
MTLVIISSIVAGGGRSAEREWDMVAPMTRRVCEMILRMH